jgi:arginine decarboxylase
VIIDRDEKGNIIDYLFRSEQTVGEMLQILGYKHESGRSSGSKTAKD